jgi:hypothetical protein
MSGPVGTLPPRLADLRRAVCRRAAAISLSIALPLIAVGAIIAYRYLGPTFCASYAAAAVMLSLVLMLRESRAYDARWLLRRLNTLTPAFEDSAELVLDDGIGGGATAGASAANRQGGGLAALQRARLMSRLANIDLPELRPGYPRRALALVWGGAALLLGMALAAPMLSRVFHGLASAAAPTAQSGVLGDVRLRVTPPSYTQLKTLELSSLDGKVPEGSAVAFALHLGTEPTSAALTFLDGSRLDLHRDGDVWRGERAFTTSTLYRLQLDGQRGNGAAEHLYRLDVIPDRAPEIIVRTPDHTLSLLASGQKTWDLVFEASDDYGLVKAELSITLAQGSGENIKTSQQTLVLDGDGDAHHRRYRKTLDLGALGFAQGDDVVVRLRVTDNRPGQANVTQSASFILRWPAQTEAASSGMEGLVQKTLPAYFASERQIIIDSEALQADRGRIEAKRFESRSDELGVEQKTLRLRYGEFLGEESEHSAQHDDDTQSTSKAFGDAGNITSEYGHVHDRPEAATLLDPDTRRILKAALDQMWQAELHLRQADPAQALPYEYKALEYIKQVQQAERIYLARAGVQLPQTDATRRLTGDRGGLSDRALDATKAPADDAPIAAIWQSLHDGGAPDWAQLSAWTRAHQSGLPDALGLLAAADRVQRDPACASCRAELLGLLWPLLPAPETALQPRRQPDAAGAAYLQALAASAGSALPQESPGPSP